MRVIPSPHLGAYLRLSVFMFFSYLLVMYDISTDDMVFFVQDWLSNMLTDEPDDLFALIEAKRLLQSPDWITPDLALSWLDFSSTPDAPLPPLIPDD